MYFLVGIGNLMFLIIKKKFWMGFMMQLGLPTSANEEKIPSPVAPQNRNLGFEGIVANHAIDHDLVELEQVTQCILLDCAGEAGILVQRISELVAGHMGGPVQDASIMLARWLENSTELRTSLQTSVLSIGCIKIRFISSLCFALQGPCGQCWCSLQLSQRKTVHWG
ncbi:Non-specific serine/threonine protein kinase protein [Dioscorea alata]|uniref:Non-specific serine/threonine protein kinase protein n=1 Tax=Dioscorea alata TaxID=55571 RepID=A0ACB7UYX6_DIOAL|nr:Non-specific serine/threonine protein kinase protein [Dioscorea alata]